MSKTMEVESCLDCRFRAIDDHYHICSLGLRRLGMEIPKEPPLDCPLREGAVMVKLKEAPQMTRAEYLKAVKQAYPKAISSIYTDYNRGGYLIFDRTTKREITSTFTK